MYTFVYLIILAYVLYNIYLWRGRQKYYKQGLNGLPYLPFFGSNLYFLFKPFYKYEQENFKKFKGKEYVDFVLDKNGVIVTSSPEIIRKILIKDFHNFSHRVQPKVTLRYVKESVIFQNEGWKRVRTQVTPVFASGRLKIMYKNFHVPAQTCADNVKELIDQNKGDQINVKKLMKSYSLDMIGNVVFSLQTNSFKDDDFSKRVTDLFAPSKLTLISIMLLPKFIINFLGISFIKKSTVDYFAQLTLSIIEDRKKNKNAVYNDFIEMLLKSEAEEGEVKSNFKDDGRINKKLTIDEIIGQSFLFFLAGMETVGTSLSMLFYELALNQDIQDKLYKDLIACYPNDEVPYEDLNKSNYLECVINETLRKHTTLNRIFRRALGPYDFGDFKIEKGQAMGISLYNLHNDPAIYQDPHKFRPERFENGEVDTSSLPVHIPFVDGPRNCIGNRFAMIEMKSLVIKLIKTYRVYATDKTAIPLRVRNSVNLNMVYDFTLGFEKRE